MVLPLIPLILTAVSAIGLGVSAASNLYKQGNQRKLYSQQENAYNNLHNGYNKYLAQHGRSINPDRAWTSYYGQAQAARNNIENSYASSIGTVGGTFGAGAMFGQGLYKVGHTSKKV